jgi:hypothetical protein
MYIFASIGMQSTVLYSNFIEDFHYYSVIVVTVHMEQSDLVQNETDIYRLEPT